MQNPPKIEVFGNGGTCRDPTSRIRFPLALPRNPSIFHRESARRHGWRADCSPVRMCVSTPPPAPPPIQTRGGLQGPAFMKAEGTKGN